MTYYKIIKGNIIITPTQVDKPTLVINKEPVVRGIDRHIIFEGNGANLSIYTKNNDLAQTATYLTGSLTNGKDWNDATYDSVVIGVSTAETDWVVIDLGTLDYYYIHYKFANISYGETHMYYSEDNVTWTQIDAVHAGTKEGFVKVYCRYVKFTYLNANTTYSGAARIYSCEIFRAGATYAAEYAEVDSITNYNDYIIKSTDALVMAVLDKTGNYAQYSIIDIDPTDGILIETVGD